MQNLYFHAIVLNVKPLLNLMTCLVTGSLLMMMVGIFLDKRGGK